MRRKRWAPDTYFGDQTTAKDEVGEWGSDNLLQELRIYVGRITRYGTYIKVSFEDIFPPIFASWRKKNGGIFRTIFLFFI